MLDNLAILKIAPVFNAQLLLDGIFIGATRTREMRDAAFMSIIVFMLAWWWLTPLFGNRGLFRTA